MNRLTRLARQDRGAAMVWAMALAVVIGMVGVVCLAAAQQALGRQRAATAADLAAIAGAQALTDPCTHARVAAERNGASLTACAVDDSGESPDVVLSVQVPAPELVIRVMAFLGRTASPVSAGARAGAPD